MHQRQIVGDVVLASYRNTDLCKVSWRARARASGRAGGLWEGCAASSG